MLKSTRRILISHGFCVRMRGCISGLHGGARAVGGLILVCFSVGGVGAVVVHRQSTQISLLLKTLIPRSLEKFLEMTQADLNARQVSSTTG